MPRSVRLDTDLERKLTEASRVSGKSPSEIIREGVAHVCDAYLGAAPTREPSTLELLGDFVGAFDSSSPDYRPPVRRKPDPFGDYLVEQHERKLARWREDWERRHPGC